jgi:hypothetical protein
MKKNAISVLAAIASFAAIAEVKIVEPAQDAVVPLLTDAQKAYIAMPTAERREKFADKVFRSKEMGLPAEQVPGEAKKREAYWPKTVRLAWEGTGDAECQVRVKDAKKGVVVIDEKVKGGELFIDNLEIAAEYEWGVKCGDETARGKFKTEDIAPRLIRYPGVPNVRDFGGRIGLGGKRIRQGMVFRSAGLNGNARDIYYTIEELRELGKTEELKKAADEAQKRLDQLLAWQADPKTMDLEDKEYLDWARRHVNEPPAKFLSSRVRRARDLVKAGGEPKVVKGHEPGKCRVEGEKGEYIRSRFGIKTDIDLRSDRECFGMTGSPLGPTVKWEHISSSAYGGMVYDGGKKPFAKVFRVFLDEKNYPIDFHCIAGQDRTGAVAYILNGLLGVDEDQLALDWEVTGFWNRGTDFSHAKRYDKLVEGFKKHYPAPTVRERLEKYVLDLGFTEEDIAKFRKIMLED